ncbi:hypothetical protein Ddye_013950 [Dipteronia dyeriana]|uniref:Protein FAR1-RELATED SEQUENCE n=1 Tax=Dipteronia dyeriana TaxID=168575 RepID=A0AAD9X785_9ROSI|nr:hypothetical protein Ddye_013950 [Dipteronia dyeriana]
MQAAKMDNDSFCGSTPDQFADQLWNDLLAADSYENRPVDNHDLDQQQQQQDDHLRQASMLLDPDFSWFNTTSSDCCSSAAVTEALSLGCGPAASEALSLIEERSMNHDHDNLQELNNQLQEEMMDNPIKQLSSCGNMLPPESDGEYLMSMESDGEEVESELTDDCQVPELGMKFSTEEEAYKFYYTYAKRIGFKVRKGKVNRLSNGTIRKRFLYCTREGFKCSKEAAKTTAKYHRKETRTGCPAMVQFTIENGKWEISCFRPNHNHELEGKSKLIVGSHINALADHSMNKARMEAEAKAEVEVEVEAEAKAEATNCVEFHDKYFTSLLHDEKTNCIPLVDGQSLIDCFRHAQLKEPSFLYTMQVNDKNRITNFFWTDGRSKIDYDCFGDVLIVDTTLMDGYNMIFATFLGLNHHGKCVFFGGALLPDSSIASFVWLLGTFMDFMGRRQPKTIFTDWFHCQEMEVAIKLVLPETQHLLGAWYVLLNATKHLPKCCGQSDFDVLFKKCIFDCESEEDFESMWGSLLEQYELRDDIWLKSLYTLRRKWSHFCVESTFSAGLLTIQGRESISKFLNKLTSEISSITPSNFVLHYLKTAEQQRREELEEDFRSNESAPAIILRSSPILKQAAKVYTCSMFRLFQEELLECLSLGIEEISGDDHGVNSTKFRLTDQESGTKTKFVEFNSLESCVTCSCKKYESVGILCVHALKVLNMKNIFCIPPQYILKRWTKSAKDGVVVVEDVQESEGEVADESMRSMHIYKTKLKRKAVDVITKALTVDNQLTWMRVEDYLNMALKRVEEVSTRDAAMSSRIDQEQVLNIGTMKSQLKRKKCENEAASVGSVQIKSKSSSDCAITHQHLLKEVTKGDDQGSRRAVSHSICIEENSQQSVFRSPRPPLPSQSASIQVRPDHGKSSLSVQECWKERSTRGMMTEKRIMAKMEEMEKVILKLSYEHHNIVTSFKAQRSKTTNLGESGTTTYRR